MNRLLVSLIPLIFLGCASDLHVDRKVIDQKDKKIEYYFYLNDSGDEIKHGEELTTYSGNQGWIARGYRHGKLISVKAKMRSH